MESIGYIKFEGDDIHDGLFGARESARALIGLDAALRYYVEREIPEFRKVEYDFPVKVQEGSWEASIPEAIDQLMTVIQKHGPKALLVLPAYLYLKQTAEIAAKDGLFKTGLVKDLKSVVSKAIEFVQWVVRYVKHMKGFERNPKVSISGQEVLVVNDMGDRLGIPMSCFEVVVKCPQSLLEGIVFPVSEKRTLKIGLRDRQGSVVDVDVLASDKELFVEESEEIDELPELVDGERVKIQGLVVRANEKDQSFGLQYKDHIITCKPGEGRTIASFKDGLVSSRIGRLYQTHVNIEGEVERVRVDGKYKTKPRIFVSAVRPMDDEPVMAQSELCLK